MALDLFSWWMLSITSSIVFLTLVSIYIYATRKGKTYETGQKKEARHIVANFAFVWVLMGLLVFYIVAVQMGSSLVFAVGNVAFEIILIAYLLKNRSKTGDASAAVP